MIVILLIKFYFTSKLSHLFKFSNRLLSNLNQCYLFSIMILFCCILFTICLFIFCINAMYCICWQDALITSCFKGCLKSLMRICWLSPSRCQTLLWRHKALLYWLFLSATRTMGTRGFVTPQQCLASFWSLNNYSWDFGWPMTSHLV